MLACSVCYAKSKLPLREVPRADFRASHENVVLLMCAKHALEVANRGIAVLPLPKTEDADVSGS